MKYREWHEWAVISMTTFAIQLFTKRMKFTKIYIWTGKSKNRKIHLMLEVHVCVCVCTKTIAVAHINCRHCILLKKIFMEVTRKGRLREVVHAKATSLKYHLDIYKHSNQRISKWKRSCFINFCLFFLSLSRSRCR